MLKLCALRGPTSGLQRGTNGRLNRLTLWALVRYTIGDLKVGE